MSSFSSFRLFFLFPSSAEGLRADERGRGFCLGVLPSAGGGPGQREMAPALQRVLLPVAKEIQRGLKTRSLLRRVSVKLPSRLPSPLTSRRER